MTERYELAPVRDRDALERRWRALESQCRGGSFRSWCWLGTLLPHLDDPHLLSVTRGGDDVALGLLACRGRRLILHEAGTEPWDGLTIEHNGLLIRPGEDAVLASALEVLTSKARAVTLSGVDAAHTAAAEAAGFPRPLDERFAPSLNLVELNGAYLEALSANTRAQIRRAMRAHGGEAALRTHQAACIPEAIGLFDALCAAHQADWTARGSAGAFAREDVRAFHRAFIAAALPRGEAALLCISAGGAPVGYLYQLRHSGRVFAYQAGITASSDPRAKPGLLCHALAIEHARADGCRIYDFGAGAQRYKASLAPGGAGTRLHWLRLYGRPAIAARAQWAARRIAGRIVTALPGHAGRPPQ